jgi:hypothetical protein
MLLACVCACCWHVYQVHGQVLAGWTLNQMAMAAQQAAQECSSSSAGVGQAAAGTLSRLDTFLAANWQAYVEFADGIMLQVRRAVMYASAGQCGVFGWTAVHGETVHPVHAHLHACMYACMQYHLTCCLFTRVTQASLCVLIVQVVQGEADAESQHTARQGVANLTMQLLQHLTALWVPPSLHGPALQLLQDPGSAQLMPSTESVAPPKAMLAAHNRQRSSSNIEASNAEEAVLDLLKILHACQVTAWQQLPSEGDATAAGAGLAALYSCCISQEGREALEVPADPVEALQVSDGCQHITTEERPLQYPAAASYDRLSITCAGRGHAVYRHAMRCVWYFMQQEALDLDSV